MKRTLAFCLTAVLLLGTPHRAPAPILEESPTPAPEQSAKPRAKHSAKPVASENSQSQTKRNPFDGTWVGTLASGLAGQVQYTLTISGTVVKETSSRFGAYIWNATSDGKTIRWDWKVNTSGTTTFTINADGKTALRTDKSQGGLFGPYESSATFYKMSP